MFFCEVTIERADPDGVTLFWNNSARGGGKVRFMICCGREDLVEGGGLGGGVGWGY